MLEQFSIFDRGGTVLWTERFTSVKGSPLNSLVRSVLVENRAGRNSFDCENYVVRCWVSFGRCMLIVVWEWYLL